MPDVPFVAAFSGSRGFTDARIVERAFRRLVAAHPSLPRDAEHPKGQPGLVIRVGDARGLDAIVAHEAPRWGIWPDVQVCHWPDSRDGRDRWQAAHERNFRVVVGPPMANVLIAFYAPGAKSPGTSDAIEVAERHNVPIHVYHEGRWESV